MLGQIQTLHSHTVTSDGKLTHDELLKIAKRVGIGTVIFTDHDILPNEDLLKKLKSKDYGVDWGMGIEIASGLPIELGGELVSGLHVLGLFIDPLYKPLRDYCTEAQEARLKRMQEMTRNLQDIGFDITEQDCIDVSGGEVLARPHIVTALKSKEKNLIRIEELKKEMEKAAENNSDLKSKYEIMMQQGERQYPYALFLGDDAFLPHVYVPYKYYLSFDDSVKLIRDAGGISSIAHYMSIKKKLDPITLEKLLKENRLDGVETVYGLWDMGTDLEKENEEDRAMIRGLLQKYDRVPTGGADAHREEDLIGFAENKEYSEETIGMVEKIIAKLSVNLEWSTLEK